MWPSLPFGITFIGAGISLSVATNLGMYGPTILGIVFLTRCYDFFQGSLSLIKYSNPTQASKDKIGNIINPAG